MAKTIQFTFDGEDYTLEFSRRTVRDMEASGFKLADIKNKPMTAYPILFRGAFKCHHRRMEDAVADRIYAQITNKEAFIDVSNVMYLHNGKPTRVGFKMDGEKKVRVAKATGEVID